MLLLRPEKEFAMQFIVGNIDANLKLQIANYKLKKTWRYKQA